MKTLVALAAREVTERRMLFVLALALGILPIVIPVLPYVRSAGSYAEVRDMAAFSLAIALSFGLSILLGGSLFGRDLSEGRLGFYFSRPIPGPSLWAGRFSGAFLLILGTGVTVLLPSTFTGGGLLALPLPQIGPDYQFGVGRMDFWGMILFIVGSLLFLLFLSHAATVVFRSRSAWGALDFVMVVACAVLGLLLFRFLFLNGALYEIARETGALVLGLLAALAAAGAVQVCIGRTDLKRGHKILSLTLWASMLACFGLVGLRAHWYTSASPEDLIYRRIVGASKGPWVQLSGYVHSGEYGMRRTFLINTSGVGSPVSLKGCAPYSELAFSEDGTRAAWYALGGWATPGLSVPGLPGRFSIEIMLADLKGASPVMRPSGIVATTDPTLLVLSPDGKRLAYLDGESLSVADGDTFKGIASVKLPEVGEHSWNLKLRFLSDDRVRVYRVQPSGGAEKEQSSLAIYDWDLSSRRFEQTGTAGPFNRPLIVQTDPGCERLLLRAKQNSTWLCLLLDGRTGQPLRGLPTQEESALSSAAFLPDGRIGMSLREAGRLSLKVFSRDGEEQTALPITEGWKALIIGEPSPGQILLSVLKKEPADRDERGHRDLEIFQADLGAGTARKVADDLNSVWYQWYWFYSDPATRALRSGPSTLLFMKGEALVKLDPATGTTTVILPPGRKAPKETS